MKEGFLFFYGTPKNGRTMALPVGHGHWAPVAGPAECRVFGHGGRTLPDGSYFFGRPNGSVTGFPDSSEREPDYGFSAIRVSPESGTVEISRDALGIFPLYYSVSETHLAIATDLAAILSILRQFGIESEVDRGAVFESFVYKSTPPDATPFVGVRACEFGTVRTFRIGNPVAELWKNPAFPISFDKPADGFPSAERDYRERFFEAVREIPNDGTAAVLFTGWLDSTLILDALLRVGNDSVAAITVVQKEAPKDDDAVAAEYCRSKGVRHYVVELDEASFDDFPSALSDVEDSDSVLPGLAISLRAAARFGREKGFRTLVSGSYIEPILGSNPSTLLTLKFLHYSGKFPGPHFFDGYSNDLRKRGIDYLRLAKKEIRPTESTLRLFSAILVKIFFNESDNTFPFEKKAVFDKGFLNGVDTDRNVFANYFFPEDETLALFDLLTYTDLAFRGNTRNNLLNQRIAQAEGVEILPIFARKSLRDIIFALPVERKFNPAKYETTHLDNKYFLFNALGDDVPELVKDRKKNDPSVPAFSIWLQSPRNRQAVLERLDALSVRKIFESDFLASIRRFYAGLDLGTDFVPKIAGEGRSLLIYQRIVWKLVAVEEWCRIFVDSE